MSATAVLLTIGIAVMVLLLGSLLVYMSQLVRNAYQIKIELQAELESGLGRIDDEAEKKLKWLKRDVFDEVEKVRANLGADSALRTSELQESLTRRLQEREDQWKRDRGDLIKIIEQQREEIRQLDQKVRALRRDLRRVDLAPLAEGQAAATAAEPAEPLPAQLPPPAEQPMDPLVQSLRQAAPA